MRSAATIASCSCLAGAILGSLAAAPPEVVRVRAAASDIRKWFPERTELISLTPDEFDRLIERAKQPEDRSAAGAGRILKAIHRIRWEDGNLRGETILTVRRDPAARCLLPLSPFGLPTDRVIAESAEFLTTDDGRVYLRLESDGPETLSVSWLREPEPRSDGRLFSLELPRVSLASVELDLPSRFVPDGFSSSPAPLEVGEDRRRVWKRSVSAAPFEIRLRERGDLDRTGLERPWISGPTTIDVGSASASWRADWAVALGARPSLRVVFSRGLEPIDVTGPDLESTELSRVSDQAEMTLRFRPEFRGRTTLTARGVSSIGLRDAWALPAAWPADGEWLGGRVTVRLDRSRELEACRVIQGRRLPITREDAAARIALRFEPASPGPVAELSFLRDDLSHRAKIRSWVRYSRDRSDLVADVSWTFPPGRRGEFALDFPGGWSVDGATDGDAPLPWHGESTRGGLVRVRFVAPSLDANATSYSTRVHAVAPAPAGDSPIELPRVVPVGAAADTLWLATAAEGHHVVPVRFDGIAWLEPRSFDDSLLTASIEPAELSRALAWRSVGDGEHITANVVYSAREIRSVADGNVLISPGRLRSVWRLSVRPGGRPLSTIPIAWSAESSNPNRWRLRRPGVPDLSLSARPLTMPERASLGLDRSTPGVALELPGPTVSPVVVECTEERAWPGRGSIPLLRLPAEFNLRGEVALHVGAGLVAQLETIDIKALEQRNSYVGEGPFSLADAGVPARLDHLLAYRSSEARLAVETKPSIQHQDEAMVSGRLITSLEADGTRAHDLMVRILSGAQSELEFAMPPGAELRSVRFDGRLVDVTGRGNSFVVPVATEAGSPGPELHLSYVERPSSPRGDLHRLRPALPLLKVPCTSFRWTVLPRRGYTIDKVGGGLSAIDPYPEGSSSDLWCAGIGSLFAPFVDSKRRGDDGSAIHEVARRLAGLEPSETVSLGNALSALAGSDFIVVVDRLGLREVGVSPRSPWRHAGRRPSVIVPSTARLERGGVCFLARRGIVAVTNDSSAVSDHISAADSGVQVDRSLREAALHGVSNDGRWFAIEEWLSEPSVGGVSASSRAAIAPSQRDFACNGWPGNNAWIEESSVGVALAGFALTYGFALISGFLARRLSRPRKVMLLLLSTAVASIVVCARTELVSDGMRCGTLLGIVSAWLVQAPLSYGDSGPRSSSSERSRSRPVQAAGAGFVLFAFGLVFLEGSTIFAFQIPKNERERIVAVLPFDGADPRAAPTRVILRLEDYEKLKEDESKQSIQPEIFALDAVHQLRVLDARSARLTSHITLSLDTDRPRPWSFPTSGALEIRAWLDDEVLPVRMAEEGRVGIATVSGRGQHRLRLERTVSAGPVIDSPSIFAPVNPAVSARLEVVAARSWSLRNPDGRPVARGEAAGEWKRSVGCAKSIDLNWVAGGTSEPEANLQVHGLVLWDALPSGDLDRLRLAPAGPGVISKIRLGLDAGVLVRVNETHRPIRTNSTNTSKGLEWEASFDRPGTVEEPIELEIWRPLPGGSDPSLRTARRCPRIELVGAELHGIVALRRPSNWSGRLVDASGVGPRDDETFARAWGALPADSLTLAGSVGFRGVANPEVAVLPVPLERSMRTSTFLELGAGRVDVTIQAVLSEPFARSSDLDVAMPSSFVLESAETEGLLRASSPRRGTVHLEYAGAPAPTRSLTIRGSILTDIKASADGPGHFEVPAIWPRWINANDEGGSLTLSARSRPTLEGGHAPLEIPVAWPASDAKSEARFRTTYKIERGDVVGVVRWAAEPPRVGVAIQSRLAIDGRISELDASIQYDVSGGPLESIHLKIPSEWAENATIQLIGESFEKSAETRGGWTFWTIRPNRSVWGVARLHLSSSRANEPGRTFSFPDVVPLGQGQVEKLISVERHTSRPIEIEGSAGVLAVDPHRLSEESNEDSQSTSIGAFRVTAEKWFLSIRIGGDPGHDPFGGLAQILESETSCALREDGELLGTTTWLIESSVGSALRFELAPRARVLRGRSAGIDIPVLSTAPGTWMIPFDAAGIREVEVVWTDETAGPEHFRGEIRVPRSTEPAVPSLLRVSTSRSVVTHEKTSGYEPITVGQWRVERAERIAKRVASLLDDFDRSSTQQGSALSSLLTRFALEARLAERAIRAAEPPAVSVTELSISRERERLERSRSSIAEALGLYGLDAYQSYSSSAAAAATEGPPVLARIDFPLLGDPSYYRSSSTESEAGPAVRWELREPARSHGFWIATAAALLLVLGVLMPRCLGVGLFRGRAVGLAVTLLLLVLTAMAPVPGVLLLMANWAGRH